MATHSLLALLFNLAVELKAHGVASIPNSKQHDVRPKTAEARIAEEGYVFSQTRIVLFTTSTLSSFE